MKNIIIAALVSVLVAWGTVKMVQGPGESSAKESVYDRVMRTGTIRCGYTPYSEGLQKDPVSGKLSGIYYDVVHELAKNLQLQVEYVEEVGWGQQIEGLQTGRFDMVCSPVSLNAGRARAADFSIPLFYSPVYLWVRRGSPLVTATLDDLNKPQVKILVLDGEQTSVFARNYFPKATQVTLPQTVNFSELLLQVKTGKADVTLAEPTAVLDFLAQNPGSLERSSLPKPLVLAPNILLLKRDEYAFKQMIDNGLKELFNSGFVEQAISRHEKYPQSYVRENTMR